MIIVKRNECTNLLASTMIKQTPAAHTSIFWSCFELFNKTSGGLNPPVPALEAFILRFCVEQIWQTCVWLHRQKKLFIWYRLASLKNRFYFTDLTKSTVTSIFLVIYPQRGRNQRVEQHLFLGQIKNLVAWYRDEEYLVCEDGIKMSAALSYSFLSVLN